MNHQLSRRSALRKLTGSAGALAFARLSTSMRAADSAAPKLKGRINQSVCRWCYDKVPLDNLCEAAKQMGLQSVELLRTKEEFDTVKKHGLICAMVSGVPGGITSGLNRLENHDKIVEYFEKNAPMVAEYGFPNMIRSEERRVG